MLVGKFKLSHHGASCSYTFAVITHGDNGSFWSVVYKGAKDGASQLGRKLSEVYGSQQQGQAEPDDNAENAQIQDAINAHFSGIAVSDHDPSLMNPTIAKAGAVGIPVVLLNAGCDPADLTATYAITCVSQAQQVSSCGCPASTTADAFLRPETLTDSGRLAVIPAHRHDRQASAVARGT